MSKFDKANPETINKVRESFNRQEFMHFIGARLTVLKDGYCEIELDHKKELSQQHGFFHAGIIGSLADNAAGYAAFSKMEQDSSILSVEFKINLMSPGDGEKLIAKAYVIKHGRTLTVCRSDVYIVKDAVEKLCAASQTTLIELKNRKDS